MESGLGVCKLQKNVAAVFGIGPNVLRPSPAVDGVGPSLASQHLRAFQRARRVTEDEGKAVLLEFITSAETEKSHGRAF